MNVWRKSKPATERRRRRVTRRLAALVAAMAGLMAAAVVSTGPANAIEPPDETPPNPVSWTLISNQNGRCLDIYRTFRWGNDTYGYLAARPCDGSSRQRCQTLYGTGYSNIRNVGYQPCARMGAGDGRPASGIEDRCDGSRFQWWTPVQGPSGRIQWRSQANNLCLAQGQPFNAENVASIIGKPCSDPDTYWHF